MPISFSTLTQEQKAQAFDLVATGQVTGMSLVWGRFDRLRNVSQTNQADAIAMVPQYAAEEAAAIVLGFDPASLI